MPPTPQALRKDFASALETRVNGEMGVEDSDRRKLLEKAYVGLLKDGKFDISKLSEKAQIELKKLQVTAEQFESIFVKNLLSQMRQTSLGGEKHSQMEDFARDTMDQAIAERSAQGRGSIGIAKSIFMTMGDHLVHEAVGATLLQRQIDSKAKEQHG